MAIKKAQTGMKLKAKAKALPPAGKQRPVDFEPKSKFPVTKGGGDNYDETIKRERELKKKNMMKMGGAVKKKMQMGGESNKFTIPAKSDSNKITIPSRNKITIPSKNRISIPKRANDGGAFAKLAPPYDKATYADKIAGATNGKAKMGKSIKKAQMGVDMMQSPMMKKGGSMKKCKYGCK